MSRQSLDCLEPFVEAVFVPKNNGIFVLEQVYQTRSVAGDFVQARFEPMTEALHQ